MLCFLHFIFAANLQTPFELTKYFFIFLVKMLVITGTKIMVVKVEIMKILVEVMDLILVAMGKEMIIEGEAGRSRPRFF